MTTSGHGKSETLIELKKKLKKLSREKITDDEDDELKPLLMHLHKTLHCEFNPDQSGLEKRLAAFLTVHHPYTLTGLDKVYTQICDQGLKTAAPVIHDVFQLVFPFQIPHSLSSVIDEQSRAGRAVLANAAPGVVIAEAAAARMHGKPADVSLDGEGIKVPMRLGPFPVDHPPPGDPKRTLEFLVRAIYRGARTRVRPYDRSGNAVLLAWFLG